MRRILVFSVIFLFSLVLAGCDLIPQDIQDKISVELCREDPDHELCDLDAIEQFEESAALELVNSVFEDVVDDDCDLISDSNPDLKDMCVEKKEMLIPMGVTEFKSLTIERDGEFHVVIGDTNKEDLQLKLKVRIVDQDGTPVIDFWEVTEMMVESGDVSLATAKDFIMGMFKSLFSENIDNEAFCKMYFDEGIDQDCDGFIEEYRKDIKDIEIISLEHVKEYEFRGHVTVLKMSGGSTDVGIEMHLFRQDFGPVQARRVSLIFKDDETLLMDAKENFQRMMDAYLDPTVSDADFMKDWTFDRMMNSQYQRIEDGALIEDYEVLAVEKDDNGAVYVYYRVKFKAGSSLSEKVNIAYGGGNGDVTGNVTIAKGHVSFTGSEIDMIMDQYLKDYLDESITDEKFLEMYYGAGMDTMFFKDRRKNRNSDIVTINIYSSERSLGMMIDVENDGVKSSYTVDVRVNRWESTGIMILDINDIDNDCDGLCDVVMDRDEATRLFTGFVDSFFDITYSDRMINDMYFNGEMEDSFFSDRLEMIEDEVMFEVLDTIGPDKNGVYIFILGGTESNRDHVPIKITKPVDKATPLLFILDPDDDNDSIPTEDKMALLMDYKDRFNHMSMLSSNACVGIVPEHRVDSCVMERDMRISEGYTIMDIKLVEMEDMEYVRVTYQRPDLLVAEWDIFFYYNNEGMLTFELTEHQEMMMYPDPDTLMMLEMKLNDFTLETEQACAMLTDDSMDECMEIRRFASMNSFMVKIENPRMEDQMYVIDIVFYNGDEMIGMVTYNNGYETGQDCGGNCLYVDRGNRGVNPLYAEEN